MTDERPYQNREIREMFQDVEQSLGRIETQTKLTNGRVTKLEQWRYVSMGAVGILTSFVVPVLLWALMTLIELPNTVHKAIDEALSAYDVSNENK